MLFMINMDLQIPLFSIATQFLNLTFFFPMLPFDPLKTSESLWFSDVFKGIKREHWEEKG